MRKDSRLNDNLPDDGMASRGIDLAVFPTMLLWWARECDGGLVFKA
jgi:hypothetical protein